MRKLIATSLVVALLAVCGIADKTQAQDKKDKKRTGTVVGVIKSKKDIFEGRNTSIEVLASGEEKARAYRVQYDPKVKGPMQEVLKAVRAAKVGDRVELEWVDTGEGLAMTKFQVLKKSGGDKK